MFRRSILTIALLATSLSLTGFSGPLQAAQQRRGPAWWVWVLIILILLALLIWWWLSRRGTQEQTIPTSQAQKVAPAPSPQPPVAPVVAAPAPEPSPPVRTLAAEATPAAPPKPDDLTIVEGIGPKIAGLLQAAGILTFAQLAGADVERLKHILAEARLTALADPTTWPEQAGLAAEGKWEALQELQGRLKGGRRS